MSVVAGAHNHGTRQNSPPRWTSADRRAHLILSEAVPLTSVHGNCVGIDVGTSWECGNRGGPGADSRP
jgi:hypothetical protein